VAVAANNLTEKTGTKMEIEISEIKIKNWYRESTEEWVCTIDIHSDKYGASVTINSPAKTEKEAEYSAYAMMGGALVDISQGNL